MYDADEDDVEELESKDEDDGDESLWHSNSVSEIVELVAADYGVDPQQVWRKAVAGTSTEVRTARNVAMAAVAVAKLAKGEGCRFGVSDSAMWKAKSYALEAGLATLEELTAYRMRSTAVAAPRAPQAPEPPPAMPAGDTAGVWTALPGAGESPAPSEAQVWPQAQAIHAAAAAAITPEPEATQTRAHDASLVTVLHAVTSEMVKLQAHDQRSRVLRAAAVLLGLE